MFKNGRSPITLSQLSAHDLNQTKAVIILYIGKMLDWYGRKDDMSDGQVNALSNEIIDAYPHISLEEIYLCFKKVRQNPKSYDKNYGTIDPSLFMRWLQDFWNERCMSVQDIPEEKPNVFNGDECSREEYIEMLYAKIAGGDLYANADLQRVGTFERMMFDRRYEYGAYKYWQKHRYDDK